MDCFYLSMFAFCTQISDPKIGGTYMTLLNTLNNLGYKWPATLVLSVADFLTKKDCIDKGTKSVLSSCSSKADEELCVAEGNACMYVVDGYYLCVGICVAVGIVWYMLFFRRIQRIQKIARKEWHVTRTVT
ncbi:gland protein G8A07 [Aphelenchoides avenae]|nr:gland protein G8A07 [Aphelenchus avenae]